MVFRIKSVISAIVSSTYDELNKHLGMHKHLIDVDQYRE